MLEKEDGNQQICVKEKQEIARTYFFNDIIHYVVAPNFIRFSFQYYFKTLGHFVYPGYVKMRWLLSGNGAHNISLKLLSKNFNVCRIRLNYDINKAH